MSLLNNNEFNKIARSFKDQRQKSQYLQQNLNNKIQQQTRAEREQIESLVKQYNNKVQTILKQEKSKVDQLNRYKKQIQETLHKTYESFWKSVQRIAKNPSLNDEQKEKQIQELSDYIMKSLYTQEEVNMFKNLADNMMVLLPNQKEGMSRRIHAIL